MSSLFKTFIIFLNLKERDFHMPVLKNKKPVEIIEIEVLDDVDSNIEIEENQRELKEYLFNDLSNTAKRNATDIVYKILNRQIAEYRDDSSYYQVFQAHFASLLPDILYTLSKDYAYREEDMPYLYKSQPKKFILFEKWSRKPAKYNLKPVHLHKNIVKIVIDNNGVSKFALDLKEPNDYMGLTLPRSTKAKFGTVLSTETRKIISKKNIIFGQKADGNLYYKNKSKIKISDKTKMELDSLTEEFNKIIIATGIEVYQEYLDTIGKAVSQHNLLEKTIQTPSYLLSDDNIIRFTSSGNLLADIDSETIRITKDDIEKLPVKVFKSELKVKKDVYAK